MLMIFLRYKINKSVKEFAETFHKNDYKCYLVGGAVRNMIGKFGVTDMDFTTDAMPEDVMKMFKSVIPTGLKHGTVTVLVNGEHFEVTTFRIDEGYSDGRRPDEVKFTPDLNEDLKRRDFTINSIALDLQNFKIVDPNQGRKDIKRKIIRAIGNPVTRFTEDGLRIMRAFRFSAQLGFTIEEETLKAASKCRDNLKSVSQERIRDELKKIMGSAKPSDALKAMRETGVLEVILPELDACYGVEQKGYHSYDVFEHSIYACDYAPADRVDLRLAALFHDLGKPGTREIKDGCITFHNHERLSADLTRQLLGRLKFSNDEIERITHLVAEHMFHYTSEWSDSAVRRFVVKTGEEHLRDIFTLRAADKYGMDKSTPDMRLVEELNSRIIEIIEAGSAFSIKDLDINGNDLIKAGITPGPELGKVLNFLFEAVLEDPALNNHKQLLDIGLKFYKTRIDNK
jgi:poly(A) polymerase/tRNA nucleotidyltransferase (CCA-adding enzyme)